MLLTKDFLLSFKNEIWIDALLVNNILKYLNSYICIILILNLIVNLNSEEK